MMNPGELSTDLILFPQVEATKDVQKARLECENLKRQMLQQEINFNIQKTEALTRWRLAPWPCVFGLEVMTLSNSCPLFGHSCN